MLGDIIDYDKGYPMITNWVTSNIWKISFLISLQGEYPGEQVIVETAVYKTLKCKIMTAVVVP